MTGPEVGVRRRDRLVPRQLLVLLWAWAAVITLVWAAGALAGGLPARLVPWTVTGSALIGLSAARSGARRLWWAVLHAGVHLPLLAVQVSGGWLVLGAFAAVAATVGTHVAMRPSVGAAWFAWTATALVLLAAASRLFGGAS
jgi:hypothetical protein